MLEEQQVKIELWETRPLGNKVVMGESLDGQGCEGFGSRMSVATVVSLHVCCCRFSLLSGTV